MSKKIFAFLAISLFMAQSAYCILHIHHEHHHHHSRGITILPQRDSWQSSLGSGLARGLNALADNKMKQVQAAKTAELFQNAGYTQEDAQLLAHFQQENPDNFHNVLGLLGRSRQASNDQQAAQKQVEKQQKLMRLKHQQDMELLAYKKQLHVQNNQKSDFSHILILVLSLGLVLLLGMVVTGYVIYRRRTKQ